LPLATAQAQRIADILSASVRSALILHANGAARKVRAARSGGQDVRDPFYQISLRDLKLET